MYKLLIFCIVFAVVAADSVKNYFQVNDNNRIIGGRNAFIEEFPYQVAFLFTRDFRESDCGGGILSEKWVLTAGTCVLAIVGSYVRVGSSYDNKGGSLHTIVQSITHEKFQYIDGVNKYAINNIRLVRVSEPFKFDRTCQPMLLFNAYDQISKYDRGTVAGWGTTEDGQTSHHLKSVEVLVIDNQKCNESNHVFGGIQADQFCAANPIGWHDVCLGDVGSPIAINGRIAGFVSWDRGCGDPKHYGVYEKITAHLSWIQEKLKFD